MAAYNCCSIALSSLARSPVRYGIVSPNSVSQPRSDRRSFRTQTGITTRKCAGPVRVSCLADTKAEVVTGKSWEELVLKNNTTPVLVEFYASWCGPCRMVHRIIDEIATDYLGKINCFVLDAKNDPKVAEDYDIKAVPVVLLFKNGERCESIIGTMPKEFYVAAIERVLDS